METGYALSKIAFDIYTMAKETNTKSTSIEFEKGVLFGYSESLEAIRIFAEVNNIDISMFFPYGLDSYDFGSKNKS